MAKKQKMMSKRLEAAAFSDSETDSTNTGCFVIVADIVGALMSFHLACISKFCVMPYRCYTHYIFRLADNV
jgi:hypothetical protein